LIATINKFYYLLIQVRKNNIFFLIISNTGKLYSSLSLGNIGQKKRNVKSLSVITSFLSNKKCSFIREDKIPIVLILEGNTKVGFAIAILYLLSKVGVTIIGIYFKKKVPYNGVKLAT